MPTYLRDMHPSWYHDPSVLDSWWKKAARTVGEVLGADDPSSLLGLQTTVIPGSAGALLAGGRLARAQAMGFRTNMPLYHGTAADVAAFDLAKGARTSHSPVGRLGVSTARNPAVAAEFADMAAEVGSGSGQNILRLVHRTAKPLTVELTEDATHYQVAATLEDAWEKGYDAVRLTNYTSPAGLKGEQVIVVKDPAQLRSVFARFDPRKMSSADLLASLGAVFVANEARTGPIRDRAQRR